jgi:hypothetical protein
MKAELAIQELRLLPDEAKLDQVRRPSPEHKSWRVRTGAVLTHSLGENAGVVREFRELRYHVGIWTGAPGDAEADARYFAARVDDATSLIDTAIYELGLLGGDDSTPSSSRTADRGDEPLHFVDDDRLYLRWLSDHPDGYVINANRRPDPGYLVLHRASCRVISGPSSGTTFTGGYSKICGAMDRLETFARGLGGEVSPCGICLGQHDPSREGAGSRYAPLRDYLAGVGGATTQLTFADIEKLVGRLPESARRHRAWWSNSSNTSRAWREAGWRLQSVDQISGQLTFARVAESGHRQERHQGAAAPGPYIDAQVVAAIRGADGTDRLNRSKR